MEKSRAEDRGPEPSHASRSGRGETPKRRLMRHCQEVGEGTRKRGILVIQRKTPLRKEGADAELNMVERSQKMRTEKGPWGWAK